MKSVFVILCFIISFSSFAKSGQPIQVSYVCVQDQNQVEVYFDRNAIFITQAAMRFSETDFLYIEPHAGGSIRLVKAGVGHANKAIGLTALYIQHLHKIEINSYNDGVRKSLLLDCLE